MNSGMRMKVEGKAWTFGKNAWVTNSHDSLERCHYCRIKYDMAQLKRVDLKMVCKFCIKSILGVGNV